LDLDSSENLTQKLWPFQGTAPFKRSVARPIHNGTSESFSTKETFLPNQLRNDLGFQARKNNVMIVCQIKVSRYVETIV